MEQNITRKFSVNLSFEEIRLPPFEDILVLGKKSPQGKIGVYRSFQLLVPDEFKVAEVGGELVEAVFISKKLIRKMPEKTILEILEEKVFPFVSEFEIIKVDFKVKTSYDLIEIEQ
ncbi:MAG: hypothetical protein M0R37_00065 [Bacteroidales bacterium]|nr:hypothetical protein [Bacteroidales bacterium]